MADHDPFWWVKKRHQIEPPRLEASRLQTEAALVALRLTIRRALDALAASTSA